jgi:hypothetical protein
MNDKIVLCFLAPMSDTSASDSEQEEQLLLQYLALFNFAAGAAALAYGLPLYDKTPYHDSAFTGANWVLELLNGHPERIRNELGVHKHVFWDLIKALNRHGITSSKHVYIEEQLAIFLYTCVTGLSLRHVSERFQRANETTSKFVLYFIMVGVGMTYYNPQILCEDACILLISTILHRICSRTSRWDAYATHNSKQFEILPLFQGRSWCN